MDRRLRSIHRREPDRVRRRRVFLNMPYFDLFYQLVAVA